MQTQLDLNELENISIADFLARLGHYPQHKSGKEYFYHSMIRDTPGNTPSFALWDAGGKWIDFGGPGAAGISGGGIIQLAGAYWPGQDFKELLANISKTMNINLPTLNADQLKEIKTIPKRHEGYAFELQEIKPVGSHPALTGYLKSRGIYQIAAGELQEIYYWNRNTPDQKKPYYALGWKNEHEGWEFATAKGFKSSIGQKGISIVSGDTSRAVLFEGYMDYLSWLTLTEPKTRPTAIVLNSVVLLQRAIDRVKNVPNIDVYFDNDTAGKAATNMLQEALPQTKDRSHLYRDFKDYNDYLKDTLNIEYDNEKSQMQTPEIGR
ncbi:toprim domain-containing protein [Sphingobacterium shayense]|uniref:toprim domain-containing protein n=1 Tax=Sphingobacterium shayense TaxID=626343 RepID=UPI001553A811|nr:toprim domain-containing protein [Sphingobacterium shayense]NQD69995.1 toprim domain-containing protein [Sphingobacterium shayense]